MKETQFYPTIKEKQHKLKEETDQIMEQRQILNISLESVQTIQAYINKWKPLPRYIDYLIKLSYDQKKYLLSQLQRCERVKGLDKRKVMWIGYKIQQLTYQIKKTQKALKNVEPRVKQTNGSVNKEYRVTQSSKIKPSHPKQHKESLQAQTVESGIWKFFKCFNFGASKETYFQSESQEGTPLNENKID